MPGPSQFTPPPSIPVGLQQPQPDFQLSNL